MDIEQIPSASFEHINFAFYFVIPQLKRKDLLSLILSEKRVRPFIKIRSDLLYIRNTERHCHKILAFVLTNKQLNYLSRFFIDYFVPQLKQKPEQSGLTIAGYNKNVYSTVEYETYLNTLINICPINDYVRKIIIHVVVSHISRLLSDTKYIDICDTLHNITGMIASADNADLLKGIMGHKHISEWENDYLSFNICMCKMIWLKGALACFDVFIKIVPLEKAVDEDENIVILFENMTSCADKIVVQFIDRMINLDMFGKTNPNKITLEDAFWMTMYNGKYLATKSLLKYGQQINQKINIRDVKLFDPALRNGHIELCDYIIRLIDLSDKLFNINDRDNLLMKTALLMDQLESTSVRSEYLMKLAAHRGYGTYTPEIISECMSDTQFLT